MATEIIMPAASASMTEAVLARWLKNDGDAVEKGEIVAEIETDKAILELAAEAAGIFKSLVASGATVPVGAPLGVVLGPGERVAAASRSARDGDGMAAAPVAPQTPGRDDSRVFASPLARSLALLNGLDLATVGSGSGPRGRIVKRDIEAALAGAAAGARPAVAQPRSPAPANPATPATPVTPANPATPARPAAVAAATDAAAATAAGYEVIPHTAMRRVIAQRLSESKQQVPHFYLTIHCRLDKLLALRQQINAAIADGRISVNDFVVKAVAAALRQTPAANASWSADGIRRYRQVDVSVAVATPNGLITPVVRRADTKGLGAISAEVRDLAGRARQGRLAPDDYQGGGFTISNLGMYGIAEFAAIINPPQACILAVGAAETRPVVADGAIVPATLMTCTLSVDHRVVDGAVAAEFLAAFKALIENPLGLLV